MHISHADNKCCLGSVISYDCQFVCLSVRALKEKWLELSTPKSAEIWALGMH